MSSFGQVPFDKVLKMLGACANGFSLREYLHSYCIRFNGKTYPSLPKKNQIDRGHVKKMARHLGIMDCAASFLAF